MNSKYLRSTAAVQRQHGPFIMPLMFRDKSSGEGEGGGTTTAEGEGGEGEGEDPESKELAAIGKIGERVQEYRKLLGEKADKKLFEAQESRIAELEKGLSEMEGKDIERQMKAINEANEKIYTQLLEMQEDQARDKESGKGKRRKGEVVSRKDLETFIKTTFTDVRFGDKDSGTKTPAPAKLHVNFRAAEDFGYPQTFEGDADGYGSETIIDAFTGREVDPRLYQRRRKMNLILDNFPIPTISVPKLIYLEKIEIGDQEPIPGDPGGAEWILCGTPKPQRSFRVTTGEATAKKVAIYGRIDDCLLKDVPSFDTWIREDFTDEMRETINDGLLNNNPYVDDTAPLGLKTNAIQYTPTPAYDGTIDEPNYIDAIFAVLALFRFNKEEAGQVFVSSDVWYRIHHLKDNEARYQNNNLIYTNALGQLFIAGALITPADEEDVPSTHILVVGLDPGWKVRAYGPMVLERGLNGEDFREDKTSYRGYQEFLTYFPEARSNSVLYDEWDNIFAAIGSGVPS